jgi:hypothetical protein
MPVDWVGLLLDVLYDLGIMSLG